MSRRRPGRPRTARRPSQPSRRRRAALALLVAPALAVLVGCGPAATGADGATPGTTGAAGDAGAAGAPGGPSPSAAPDGAAADAAGAGDGSGTGTGTGAAAGLPMLPTRPEDVVVAAPVPPVRLLVGAAGIDMPVEAVGVDADGTMEIPASAGTAGWYRFGPAPAGGAGSVVVAAHVDTVADGIGPFARLRDLGPGDVVELADEAGTTHRYAVTAVEQVAKTALPADALFARDGAPRLVLITCGGPFDRTTGSYRDNVLVEADRLP
ncbi:class F sortase [Cellulomonas marina]|uniref:Sortase family protein n=1 Tax=Cellulomonas marina TaxID=988821 RepID=A0A1I0Y6B6_9CELL|nr:class F sortase [Cellulomonas marina]GIG29768.1 hypothetical protein Cma02nite_23680 [Cellulomonas marina]SFB07693.1 Sortase family protein [Cellulomonas marina]